MQIYKIWVKNSFVPIENMNLITFVFCDRQLWLMGADGSLPLAPGLR